MVLKDGEVSANFTKEEATAEKLQHAMVGRHIDSGYYCEDDQKPYQDKPLLSIKGASSPGKFEDIDLELHSGEVLALVGVEGSGCEELLRSLFGLEAKPVGEVKVKGETVSEFSPKASVNSGVGYIPRERKVEGIVNGMEIYENMTLPQLEKYNTGGLLKIGKECELARDWIKRLSIKASSETCRLWQNFQVVISKKQCLPSGEAVMLISSC